ncbi:host-nuclease inhibitor Gam family protein [Parachitinimonas caeni]|uniref:Host-nuclease inhibitor Gam family protein n=1 Tax=Parachitinimonas caeni TaxID=3031301 RepID=A0ABT7DZF8_9NEIS|nr:host-nuclease inhibitor Gam family protein [Parachitinimonas caeni]MDK2124463.1 host-nuclease inhibitor Gam family protein [Parachitinimonas caeni]
MTRRKTLGTQLNDWNAVDDALRQIGELDRQLNQIETEQNQDIDQIKQRQAAKAGPLLAQKSGLERALQEFASANPQAFVEQKTRSLTFGSIGYRFSTSVVVKDPAATLDTLKRLGLFGCIRITETLDRETLKTLAPSTLQEIGAAIRSQNKFGYEIARQALAEVA